MSERAAAFAPSGVVTLTTDNGGTFDNMLEFLLMTGRTLRLNAVTEIAITVADMQAEWNGIRAPRWTALAELGLLDWMRNIYARCRDASAAIEDR